MTIAILLCTALAVAAVSGGSVAAIAVWDVASSIKPGVHLEQLPGHTATPLPEVGAIEGGVNLLLTGTDTRSGQGGVYSSKAELAGSSGAGNNDVTMLIHIAQNHQSMTIVSFPRDLLIPVPRCGNRGASSQVMINSTLSRGGLSCVVLTVEALTGVQIPFAAEISFDGVSAMSDAVGGVTVCLATPVVDKYTTPALNLPAGQQTLVGAMALSFLRSRHGIGDGSDLARISNQQVFMSALARKIASAGVLTNPFTLYKLANAAVENMTLSDTMTDPSTIVAIALALKNVGLANMVFLQYPVASDPANPNRVVPVASVDAVLNHALVADLPVQLSGVPGRAAVIETPSPTPAATVPPASSSPTVTTAPTTQTPAPSTAPGPAPVVLPATVTGQTAAEQTCTKGNSGR